MAEFGVGVTWMVLSPIALLTCILAIVIIVHYRTFFHGTDVCLLSLVACLATNVILLVPIPAVLTLRDLPWTKALCYFYTWLSTTVRVAEILSLLCMCIHWMIMLRMQSGKQSYGSPKPVKAAVVVAWTVAAIVGVMPLAGATDSDGYIVPGSCYFLPFDLGVSFALFFILLSLLSVVLSVISAVDTVLLLRYMRRVAVYKYQAGRFYLPSTSSVARNGTSTVHARYNELNCSSDLCRLVLAIVSITAAINHIPFTIIQFSQLVQSPSSTAIQTVVQWLALFQALLLPHALWIISKRYRHSLVYLWKVYFLRDPGAAEEDPASCTLQSYTRSVRDVDGQTVRVTSRGQGRHPPVVSDRGVSNHVANGQAVRANGNIVHGATNFMASDHMNASMETNTMDLDDGMEIMTSPKQLSSQQDHYQELPDIIERVSVQNSDLTSPSKSLLSTPVRQNDLRRTGSSSSRVEWKEQMRKKHLPTIFVNEAFDGDDPPKPAKVDSPKREEPKDKRKTGSDVSLYYMSSDYHHDNLAFSMPRIRHQESESEGASNTYGDEDIDNILGPNQTVELDTSMSRDINDAFREVLIGVNSEFTETEKSDDSVVQSHQGEEPVQPVQIAVLESPREEPTTPNSDTSVKLEPYPGDRLPPWMDESNASPRSNPAVLNVNGDSQFDTDVDRGFEEALSYNYPPGYAVGGLGLCFESIKEEPEEEPGNQPEVAVADEVFPEVVFKTQAVVSSRSSSRTSSLSDRPHLDDSRSDIAAPLNGICEEGSEEELAQYEKNYKGPQTSFGRFYNNQSSDDVGVTAFRTFGYSEEGPPSTPKLNSKGGNSSFVVNGGNQNLKPLEHIDHDDSFYAEDDSAAGVHRKAFTFTDVVYQNGHADQAYYFDGNGSTWSDPSKRAIGSLGPWPEYEEDMQEIDMSFDSDFSDVSTSNSQSDFPKPIINGGITSGISSQEENGIEVNHNEKPMAFF